MEVIKQYIVQTQKGWSELYLTKNGRFFLRDLSYQGGIWVNLICEIGEKTAKEHINRPFEKSKFKK